MPVDQKAINGLKLELERGSHKQELYMKPVLENDALLHSIHVLSGQSIIDDEENDSKQQHQKQTESQEAEESTTKLKEVIASYKATLSVIMSDNNEPTTTSSNNNRDYFQSYSNVYIHETMLRDEPRMNAYSTALSSEYLRGKTVLDVGCGSGILCMLAAKGIQPFFVSCHNPSLTFKLSELTYY